MSAVAFRTREIVDIRGAKSSNDPIAFLHGATALTL
jgi:hypothetical protein